MGKKPLPKTSHYSKGLQSLAPLRGPEEVMSNYSGSTEDEYERFKEAVDKNFLTEDLYKNDKSKKKPENLPQSKSLRNQSHQEISNNPFSIKVTPEFQRHVSKHLSKLLDDIIDEKQVITKSTKIKKSHLKYGVKLLNSSKDYLLSRSNNDGEIIKQKKILLRGSLDTDDYEKKAKEVAVTSEWVLSKEETKHWAPSTRGDIEIIKLDSSEASKKKKKKLRKTYKYKKPQSLP